MFACSVGSHGGLRNRTVLMFPQCSGEALLCIILVPCNGLNFLKVTFGHWISCLCLLISAGWGWCRLSALPDLLWRGSKMILYFFTTSLQRRKSPVPDSICSALLCNSLMIPSSLLFFAVNCKGFTNWAASLPWHLPVSVADRQYFHVASSRPLSLPMETLNELKYCGGWVQL